METESPWLLYNSVKIENPSTVIPINTGPGNECSIQFWTGDEDQQKLFLSSRYFLVEVEDTSRLQESKNSELAADDGNCDACRQISNPVVPENKLHTLRKSTKNPQLLVPKELGVQIGLSRLTDLGPLSQHSFSSIYTIKKLLNVESNREVTLLEMDNETYSLENELHDKLIDRNSKYLETVLNTGYTNDDTAFECRFSIWDILLNVLKRPFLVFFENKNVFLTMLTCRFIFGFICKRYGVFLHSKRKTTIILWLKNRNVMNLKFYNIYSSILKVVHKAPQQTSKTEQLQCWILKKALRVR